MSIDYLLDKDVKLRDLRGKCKVVNDKKHGGWRAEVGRGCCWLHVARDPETGEQVFDGFVTYGANDPEPLIKILKGMGVAVFDFDDYAMVLEIMNRSVPARIVNATTAGNRVTAVFECWPAAAEEALEPDGPSDSLEGILKEKAN